MKKRILAVILACACVISGVAMASGGSQADPMISKSYLDGTYWSSLISLVDTGVSSATKSVYDKAVAKLSSQTGSQTGGWTSSASFRTESGGKGSTVKLALGASLLWTSGTGTAGGTLVDVTTGKEVPAGGSLTANHRYLAPNEATVTVMSQSAQWSVQGKWVTSATASGKEMPFTDVPEDSWYYDAVYYVWERGLFIGTTETTFEPDLHMERGMLTTVIYRMAGSPSVTYSPIFSDVPKGMWYTDGTVWAGKNGIVSGVGDGRFLPADDVERQQVAIILYNYAKYMGYDVSESASLSRFTDGDTVADWSKEAMGWAVSAGILMGDDLGAILPWDSATRAQVACMLQRFEAWMDRA